MSNVPFAAQMEELAAFFASKISVPTIGIGGGYAPIGTINFFDATTAPQDWLACDGSVHNIADYPQLAEWYATQHGAANFYGGNGTTTFAVPNLQGEFLRGTGTNSHSGQGSGAAVGVHQDATQVPNVSYSYTGKTSVTKLTTTTATAYVANYDTLNGTVAGQITSNAGTSATSSGTNAYFTTRPTNTSFLICVKAVVAGEVYSTEERVVGTWLDGKPLYQRAFSFTSAADCSTTQRQSIGMGTFVVDVLVDFQMLFQASGNTEVWNPMVGSDVSAGLYGYAGFRNDTGELWYRSNFTNVNSRPITGFIRYTKKAD